MSCHHLTALVLPIYHVSSSDPSSPFPILHSPNDDWATPILIQWHVGNELYSTTLVRYLLRCEHNLTCLG